MHIAAAEPRFLRREDVTENSRPSARSPATQARPRQAGEHRREDGHRQDGEVLPRPSPRAGLHQGPRKTVGQVSWSGPARAPWTCASSGSSSAKARSRRGSSLGFFHACVSLIITAPSETTIVCGVRQQLGRSSFGGRTHILDPRRGKRGADCRQGVTNPSRSIARRLRIWTQTFTLPGSLRSGSFARVGWA